MGCLVWRAVEVADQPERNQRWGDEEVGISRRGGMEFRDRRRGVRWREREGEIGREIRVREVERTR
jgi:hypothetical protein